MVDALFCPHAAFCWALPPILLLPRPVSADEDADFVAILPLQLLLLLLRVPILLLQMPSLLLQKLILLLQIPFLLPQMPKKRVNVFG